MKNKDQILNGSDLADIWIERIELGIAVLIQIVILVVALVSILNRQWLPAFSGTVIFLLSFVPALLERQLRVQLPVEVSLITSLFLLASYALGEVGDFYERFWWWDLLLHGSSAIVTGLIGFLAVYVFYVTNRIRIAPIYVASIAFCTAVTVGTLWEIFEYAMDLSFGLNMQRSGLTDTMTDLIVNAVGALTAAAIGFYFVRHDNELNSRRFIRALVEKFGSGGLADRR